ncbi:MAG: hypothetical protein HC932_02525 [Thermales bacterium]|nr:hypothetical protein [Thermales bacterium]
MTKQTKMEVKVRKIDDGNKADGAKTNQSQQSSDKGSTYKDGKNNTAGESDNKEKEGSGENQSPSRLGSIGSSLGSGLALARDPSQIADLAKSKAGEAFGNTGVGQGLKNFQKKTQDVKDNLNVAKKLREKGQEVKDQAKDYVANNVKKVLVQAVSAIWTFIAPFLPWIAGFVFLVIMFLTLFSSVVIYAYCYEEDPRVIRSTLEVALTGNLAAGLSVTGLSDPAAPKSELRQYLEKEGGVCRKINPNFCADGGIGSQGVSNDGGGIGVDGVSCLSVKSGLSPELRAFMRTLSIAEGTKDTAGYYRLVGGKEFPSTNKTHPGVEDPSLFSKNWT